MRIYLIGYMGAGKSTVAKVLSRELGVKYLDLDQQIEVIEGRTISEIFAQDGEARFREIERDALRSVSESNPDTIISLGGGTPCFHNSMEYVIENGVAVYLKLAPTALAHRLLNAKAKRPLLEGKTAEQLLVFIEDQLEKREVYYNKAQIVVDNSTRNIQPLLLALDYFQKK